MRGVAAIHQETSAVARKGDDVVPGSRNQRDLIGELVDSRRFGCITLNIVTPIQACYASGLRRVKMPPELV